MSGQYCLDILLCFSSIFIPGDVYFMLLLFLKCLLLLLLSNDDLTENIKAITHELLHLHIIPLITNWHLYPEIDMETMSLTWMNKLINEQTNQCVPLILDYVWHFTLCINLWCIEEYLFYDYKFSVYWTSRAML